MEALAAQAYRTPEKRPVADTSTKGASSAVVRPWRAAEDKDSGSDHIARSQIPPRETGDRAISQKLQWFESRTQQLRAYLDAAPQIDHQRVRVIFGWAAESPPEDPIQTRVLKDLSSKVRALIKENTDLRGNTPTQELAALRDDNQRLQALVDQLKRAETARENILSEENQYLRDYINNRRDPPRSLPHQHHSPARETQQETHSLGSSLTPAAAVTPQEAASLRKHVMAYINTVIESNDEKLEAQQRYLQALERRVSHLDGCEQLLNHLRFEKEVKLQQSNRKSKNFTANAPNVPGDHLEYELDADPVVHKPQQYFTAKPKQKSKIVREGEQQTGKEMAALVMRSAQLQEELTSLQEKYENEMENHIRESSDREELAICIQKLTAEKGELRHQVADLEEQLKASLKRVGQLEKGAGRLRVREELLGVNGLSLEEELGDIKRELLSCGVEDYQAVQKQISQAFAERDRLRRALQEVQATRADQSRFSGATREIFLLRERNSQLEQSCRFYEQQIQEYEQQLRQISADSEERLARAISNDFKEMRAADQELQGLKWPRQAHSCMLNSVARIDALQNHLAAHRPA